MAEFQYSADRVIMSNYTKFNRLDTILRQTPIGNISSLAIYIDLNSVLHTLFSSKFFNNNIYAEDNSIASGIINMVAHYRRFFKSAGVVTKFHLIYSTLMEPTPRKFVPEYNSTELYRMQSSEMADIIYRNMKLVETIVPYLPDVTMTITGFEPGVVMWSHMGYMTKNCYADASMVISKDPVVWQLCCIEPKVFILRPSKHNGEDVSYTIYRENLYRVLCNELKVQYREEWINIDPGLYTRILALTRVPTKDMKSLASVPEVFNELLALTTSSPVPICYTRDTKYLSELFSDKMRGKIQYGNFDGRWKAIDIPFLFGVYASSPEATIASVFKNLYDPKGIHEIDTKYFSKCHLHLEDL